MHDAQGLDIAVVRFLALLELYKEGAVDVHQDAPLAEISVRATEYARAFVPAEPAVSAHDTRQGYTPEHRDSADDLTFSESVKNAGEETA